MWTQEKENEIRKEIKKRFIERTPPKIVADLLPEYRVTRDEINQYSMMKFNMIAPIEGNWLKCRAKWYRRMAKSLEA